jgi:hypothetical protein
LSEEKLQGNEEAPDSKARMVVFGDVLHKGHDSQGCKTQPRLAAGFNFGKKSCML